MVFAGPFRAERARVGLGHNRRPPDAADATAAAPRAMSPRRAWLCALYDQLGDIGEAIKHNLAPLVSRSSGFHAIRVADSRSLRFR